MHCVKVITYLLAACAILSGCATNISTRLQPALAAAKTAGPIECAAGCKVEWERAQLWLTKHSKWKLQTATDVVLQTYNAINYEVSYAFTVTKEPVKEGSYKISLALACGNPLGCDPNPGDVQRAFYHYVATGDDVLAGQGYLGSIR